MAKMVVIDEINVKPKALITYEKMSFVEFLEFLVRLAPIRLKDKSKKVSTV